jgi:hypothetical protein
MKRRNQRERHGIGEEAKERKIGRKETTRSKWSNRGIFGQQVKYMGAILENQTN